MSFSLASFLYSGKTFYTKCQFKSSSGSVSSPDPAFFQSVDVIILPKKCPPRRKSTTEVDSLILHKGETLFRQGENGPLFHIKGGMLKVLRVHEDGNPVLVNIIVPGETIPHHSLITPTQYYGTAVALVTSEIEIVPSQAWYESLQQQPERCLEIALLLQNKLRMMQQRIDQLTQVAPADKLRKLQSWFAAYIAPESLTDVLTQDEIGQLIGLRRETVNRLLRAQPIQSR